MECLRREEDKGISNRTIINITNPCISISISISQIYESIHSLPKRARLENALVKGEKKENN